MVPQINTSWIGGSLQALQDIKGDTLQEAFPISCWMCVSIVLIVNSYQSTEDINQLPPSLSARMLTVDHDVSTMEWFNPSMVNIPVPTICHELIYVISISKHSLFYTLLKFYEINMHVKMLFKCRKSKQTTCNCQHPSASSCKTASYQ